MDIGDMVGICTAVAFVFVIVGWFVGWWTGKSESHESRQRATAKRYEEREKAAYKQAAEVAGAFQLGYDMGRRRVMGGIKTVTASAGYEFEITASNGRKWVVGEYTEGSDGYISFAQYPEWAVLKPTIELVPIKEPEPVPEPVPGWACCGRLMRCWRIRGCQTLYVCPECGACVEIPSSEPEPEPQGRTVTAPEGYEFGIRFSAPLVDSGVTRKGAGHVTEYVVWPDGMIDFRFGAKSHMRCLPDTYTIELVPIPEPEPEPQGRTVTAPEGYEFRIVGRSAKYDLGPESERADRYTVSADGYLKVYTKGGTISCSHVHHYIIELVEVTNATSEPEPEPDSEPISFEFPLPDACKKGDWIRIDLQGHWSLLRYATVPTRTSISQGQAEPSRNW